MEVVDAGFKMTEVGMIPFDWRFEPIDSFAKITTGAKDTQDRDDEGKYPFFVRSQKVERIRSYSFDGEAILTSGDGVGVGKIYHYINGMFDFHQRVYCMYDFREDVHGKYFFYQFSSKFYDRVMSMTAKSSVDSVRREMIADMKIPLPPTLTEQKAIATALSDVDALISSLDKLIEKKKAIKQGAMQELLTGKTRLAGFGNGVGYKMTEVGRIPSDWNITHIDAILDKFQNGYAFSSNGYKEEGVPIVTMAQIGLDGSFQFNEDRVNYWNYEKGLILKDFLLKEGDLIISMTDVTPEKNLIGRMTIIDRTGIYLLNQRVGLLKVNHEKIIPDLIKNISNSNYWRTYCKSVASLGVQANIGTKEIRKGLIALPPSLTEQKAIAYTLKDMDSEIGELEVKRDKYKLVKQGMMQELLTGKTRLV